MKAIILALLCASASASVNGLRYEVAEITIDSSKCKNAVPVTVGMTQKGELFTLRIRFLCGETI